MMDTLDTDAFIQVATAFEPSCDTLVDTSSDPQFAIALPPMDQVCWEVGAAERAWISLLIHKPRGNTALLQTRKPAKAWATDFKRAGIVQALGSTDVASMAKAHGRHGRSRGEQPCWSWNPLILFHAMVQHLWSVSAIIHSPLLLGQDWVPTSRSIFNCRHRLA